MTDTPSLPQIPSDRAIERSRGGKRLSKLGYLGLGLLANTLIWGLALAYLNLTPKGYRSEWGVKVLSGAPRVDVTLPQGWRTSASSDNRRSAGEDPRSDYVYLIQSPDLLKAAAAEVEMSVEDFGEPNITTNPQSSIIEFVIEGETPEMAQRKAQALHTVLDRRIEQLRKSEVLRREAETRTNLESARRQVESAQRELSAFQSASGLNSDSQIENLAVGIEQLRREYAVALAEESGLNSRAQKLADDVNESSAGASDAYLLQSDPVYQSQFEEYGVIEAEFADISAQLGPQHPQVVAKRAERDGLLAALERRGTFLLGRPVDQSTLAQLAPLGIDPRVAVSRGELFKDAVSSRADQTGLLSQTQELSTQIVGLEDRLRRLSEDKLTSDRLQQNLRTAETLLASAVTKLSVNENDIYSIYPPIQLAAEPTLPDEDKYVSPSPTVAIVGALAGSFLATTGLLLLWTRSRNLSEDEFESAEFPFRA